MKLSLYTLVISAFVVCAAAGQQISAPEPQPGTIVGTVIDVRNDVVPNASIAIAGTDSGDQRTITANDNGFFTLDHVKSGTPYHLTISAPGFKSWLSDTITLTPGQYLDLSGVKLQIAVEVTTVAAVLSPEEIATEQVHVAEKQRVLGIIPNFYVTYDKDPVPLTTKLKFQLAMRTMTDPVTFAGAAFIAGIDQAGDTPAYQQGLKGYGQRFGANYANGLTDILIGGAILPSILHQDPRYFYQGTGTNKSRVIHALSTPIICRGDNGRKQINFSSLGGYFASGLLADTYYPEKDRGPGLILGTAGIDIAANMANGLIQEFLLRKFTPSAKNKK